MWILQSEIVEGAPAMAQLLECGDCCALLTAERMAVHEQTLHRDTSSELTAAS